MHKIITDFPSAPFQDGIRKSVTFETEPSPTFHVRRTYRSVVSKDLEREPLKGGSLPLSESVLKTLRERKFVYSESLLDWPFFRPILKFSIARHQNLYILTASDEQNTDSYYLKTKNWEQVSGALRSLTHGQIALPGPAILEFFNPFSLYAPFDATPLRDDFETLNNGVILSLQEAIEKLKDGDCAGYMRGKLLTEYNRILADLERVGALLDAVTTPSKSDFENESLEK